MTGLELLEKYPLSGKVVSNWFINQMLESLKDESLPEEFRKTLSEEGIGNDKLGTLIDVNPRVLFDVFDENKIFIETFLFPDETFGIKLGNQGTTNSWKTRREAEVFSVECAFELLENKLSPTEEKNN
jgi:hypothetical protein